MLKLKIHQRIEKDDSIPLRMFKMFSNATPPAGGGTV